MDSSGDIWKIIYLGFEKSQRSVTRDILRYINILTYLLTVGIRDNPGWTTLGLHTSRHVFTGLRVWPLCVLLKQQRTQTYRTARSPSAQRRRRRSHTRRSTSLVDPRRRRGGRPAAEAPTAGWSRPSTRWRAWRRSRRAAPRWWRPTAGCDRGRRRRGRRRRGSSNTAPDTCRSRSRTARRGERGVRRPGQSWTSRRTDRSRLHTANSRQLSEHAASLEMASVFTARRYASALYAVVVCLSVTLRYCIEMAKRRITHIIIIFIHIMPHDPRDSNFLTPRITAILERDHPIRGYQTILWSWKSAGFWRGFMCNCRMQCAQCFENIHETKMLQLWIFFSSRWKAYSYCTKIPARCMQ